MINAPAASPGPPAGVATRPAAASGRLRVQILAGCALLALLLAAAPAVSAAPLPGSAYDTGDGNQDNALGLDWQGANAAGAVQQSPDANDDCFVGGVKELTPNAWAFNTSAGGCTPGKSNVRVAYANAETTAATTFGHFAFFRNDTTGNTFLTFELNQSAANWTNATGTTIPCRSNGDVLLSFEVGGSSLATSVFRWTGDGSGPAGCRDGASGTFAGSGTVPANRFQGAMNATAPIANFVNPAAYGAAFPANSFGEAAIDLPAVLQSMGHSPCFGFVRMQVHSRSSSSISSAMIDYTKPVPVRMHSCAVTGTQYQDSDGSGTRDDGEPGVAGFEVYADLDADGSRDAGEPSATSDATGYYRILGVPAGSFPIRQVPRTGWRCSQPSPCHYDRTMATGGSSTGNDFGNLGPSTASGTAFEDLDADGIRDAGEPDLGELQVYADLDGDGTPDAGEPAGISGTDGAWSIEDVPAGSFTLRAAPRAGWTCSAPAACGFVRSFSSGSAATGLSFGGYRSASVAGNVFEDLDGDGGSRTGGDPALAGTQVYDDLNGNDLFDVGEPQTVADGAGNYTLSGLAPGPRTLRVTPAAASWYCTRPALGSACEHGVTLASGQAATAADFGLARSATVAGTKFADGDGNGVKDGSDGALAGFEFWIDYDNDNAADPGEPGATSDAAGNWTITGVRAGAWTLREVPNGAYACTKPSPCTYALTLASGATAGGYQFGNYISRSVSGTVFNDADADSLAREPGEAGVAGWVVYSDANSNSSLDLGEPRSTTNSLGQYNLTGLANGNYRIRIVAQAGWTCSYPASCLLTGSIGSGQSDANMNFGVWGSSAISGTVFEDADADGAAREDGEAPLSGRVVYVDANNNSVMDTLEPSATTDGAGAFRIPGNNPGSRVLRQVLPAGWTCSRPAPCAHQVTLSAGDVTGRDFGSHTTGEVAGDVFEDADADGARGAGEAAIAGRTVYLDADGDAVHDAGEPSQTTGGSGGYAFGGVAPGAYTVRQILPAGWTDSAPAPAQRVTVTSRSALGASALGSYAGAQIAGTAFEDANFDGSGLEPGDSPVAGRTVYLDTDASAGMDAGEPSDVTDASGDYAFSGLKPGSYTVRILTPATWACAHPDGCSRSVTVGSRESSAGNDFGSYVGATVTGTVFEDADADAAAREAGEDGVAGRRVYLDADADATRDATEPATVTGADGTFSFTGVTARGWTVRLELDGTWSCDSPAACAHRVALTSGAQAGDLDFGIHDDGTISGHLFTDRDNDGGPQVFGENDQPGRTVYADADDDGTLDAGEPSATSDDRGDYVLSLPPGSHRIRQVLPAGWSCSTPDPCSRSVTLRSRDTATGNDFSSWTVAELSGTFFEDSAGDGDFPEPGEPGIAGRTLYLDLDGDEQHDAGEPETDTAADGAYEFAGLAPGRYVVRTAAEPSGWTCSYPASCTQELWLEAAERAQDVNFGAWTTGTVAGVAYDDSDDSATMDPGEAPLSGRTIYADLDDDEQRDESEPAVTTGPAGTYELTLEPGPHTLRQADVPGWNCIAPTGCARSVSVTSRGALTGLDFGSASGVGAAGGSVFEDVDGDLTRDGADDGVADVTVYADSDDDGIQDDGEPATTTDAGGAYRFATLPAGGHVVRIATPQGWQCLTPGCTRTISVVPGEETGGQDFAIAQDVTIAGELYDDDDGDGQPRESGDDAVSGSVELRRGGALVQSTTSSATTGAYELTGVEPGTYSVVTELGGRTCTRPATCVRTLTVGSGDARDGQDFGGYVPATASGTVHDDLDGDGTIGAGEPGAPLGVVWVDADGNGERDAGEPQVAAAADGSWSLSGLPPGTRTFRLDPVGAAACARPAACAQTHAITSGDTLSGLDLSAFLPGSIAGTLSGPGGPLGGLTVYLDLDGDGERSADEPAVTTGDDGAYALAGLVPGTYNVRLDLPLTYVCSAPDGCAHAVGLTSGESVDGHDFSAFRVAALLGTVSEDADASGTIDAGEAGEAGITVYLDADGDGTRDDAEPVTATDAEGGYTFAGLAPGSHTVRLDLAAGTTCSLPAACARTRTLSSGGAQTGLDFAVWRAGGITGTVFDDRDGDGSRSGEEPVRAGVTIYLDGDGDAELDGDESWAMTGAGGSFTLAGIRPGAHALRVQPDGGWSCTFSGTCRVATTVSSGTVTATADLGLRKVALPVAPDETSSGAGGAPQTTMLPVPAGGSIVLLDAAGVPALRVTVAGVGEYVLDPVAGRVTFTPEPGFHGVAPPIGYRVTDADGATADGTYTPTVAAHAPPPPSAAPPAPAPAPATRPAASAAPAPAAAPPCVSRRAITIHWKVLRGSGLRRISISLNGRLHKHLRGNARKAVIDLRGRPLQTVRLKISALGRGGRSYAARRTYRTCRPAAHAPRLETLTLRRFLR